MRFRVAFPQQFSRQSGHADLLRFYHMLFACIRERGHELQIFPDIGLPPEEKGCITLGYHSRGRRPLTWHIKKSYLRAYFSIDRDGYSAWSEMALSPEGFQAAMREDEAASLAFVARMRAEYFDRGLSKYHQPQRHFDGAGPPYVFLPLQLPEDEVMRVARIDYFSFARTVAAALAGSGYRLVLKRHPACRSPAVFRLLAELGALPHVQVSNTAINSLIAGAAAVVCINSGAGFESLFYYRPLFTAGASDYEWVSQPLADLAELARLPSALGTVPDQGRIARFLSYYCQHGLVREDDHVACTRHLMVLEQQAHQDPCLP